MGVIQDDMEMLASLAAQFEPDRWNSAIVNDMFEAADSWKDLGSLILDDKGYNIPGRVQQEVERYESMKSHYGIRLNALSYDAAMKAGARMIEAGKNYRPPLNGYLGAVKTVRQTFAFMETEFSLVPGPYQGMAWDYTSDKVSLRFTLPNEFDSCCRIKQAFDMSLGYSLEDLLFMGGLSVSLALPPGQNLETEADVQAWFTTVANILRDYGSDVLADQPGAFERLAQAAAERERLYIEECERLYGTVAEPAAAGPTGNP